MITQNVNEATGSATDVYQILTNVQNSINNLTAHLEFQQNQINQLSSQQPIQIQIPQTQSGIQSTQVDYSGIMRRLIVNKFQNPNFVARDRHDIDFLSKMLDDYEAGTLPQKTQEAWQERVCLINSVSESGWSTTIQRMKEKRPLLPALLSPKQLNQVYNQTNWQRNRTNRPFGVYKQKSYSKQNE